MKILLIFLCVFWCFKLSRELSNKTLYEIVVELVDVLDNLSWLFETLLIKEALQGSKHGLLDVLMLEKLLVEINKLFLVGDLEAFLIKL